MRFPPCLDPESYKDRPGVCELFSECPAKYSPGCIFKKEGMACEPWKASGIPTHPAAAICKTCTASKCCVTWNCPKENEIREDEKRKLEDINETILDDFRIREGTVEITTHGGAGHRTIINLANFYEANGGPNFYTATLQGTVRGELRKYEVTIRNLKGNKSPAEMIKDLRKENADLKTRLEKKGD